MILPRPSEPNGWSRTLLAIISCTFVSGIAAGLLAVTIWWHHVETTDAIASVAAHQQVMVTVLADFRASLDRANVLAAMPAPQDRETVYPAMWAKLSDADKKTFPRALRWTQKREPLGPEKRDPSPPESR